jgi:Gpi18-like mannosyltransferase
MVPTNANIELHQTGYPFFPLFPWILRLLSPLGISYGHSPAVAMVAFGIGLIGLYRITQRHSDARTGELAVWSAALLPMSGIFSLAYPSGLMFALSVWAFDHAERERDLPAGLLAAAACLPRPNGCVVAMALTVVAWRRAPRLWLLTGPAILSLAGWLLPSRQSRPPGVWF